MQKYKLARWRRILRRSEFRRRQIRSIRRLRHSRSCTARTCSAVILSIAWLILPLLPGCGAGTGKPAASQSDSSSSQEAPNAQSSLSNALPPPPANNAKPTRMIRFRGVDNDYQGSTQVLPNDKLVHQKEQHD